MSGDVYGLLADWDLASLEFSLNQPGTGTRIYMAMERLETPHFKVHEYRFDAGAFF